MKSIINFYIVKVGNKEASLIKKDWNDSLEIKDKFSINATLYNKIDNEKKFNSKIND